MSVIRDYIEYERARLDGDLAPSTLDEDDLDQIEEELGVALPPSYRELVLGCDGEELYGQLLWVGDDVPDLFNMVQRRKGTDIPSFLLPLYEEGGGDVFCFDTRHPDDAGEYMIVRVDHELDNKRRRKFEGIAPNFSAFIEELMRIKKKHEGA